MPAFQTDPLPVEEDFLTVGRKNARIICTKCRERIAKKGQSWCNACHAAYMRANRKRHSELTPPQKMKSNARSYANVYQRRGKLKKQPCQMCGAVTSEKHHEDYSKPLEVQWLCRRCHLQHLELKKILAHAAPPLPAGRPRKASSQSENGETET